MREINKKQLIALAILAGLNLLFSNLVAGNGQRLTGEAVLAHSPEMRRATLVSFVFGLQAISFILGGFAALIPYKKKLYSEKWLTFSLGIAITIQAIFLLGAVVKLIFW